MSDRRAAARLALGRILRLASRPEQPGDVDEYERCRAIIIASVGDHAAPYIDNRPNWARDRNRGAAGD